MAILLGDLDPVSVDEALCWRCDIDKFVGGTVIDMGFFQELAANVPVKQREEFQQMRVLTAVVSSQNQFSESSLRNCPAHGASCFGEQQRSKAGLKRRLWETNNTVVQHCSTAKASPRRRNFFGVRGSNSSVRKGENYEGSNVPSYKISISISCKDKFQCISKSIFQDRRPILPSLDLLSLANEVTKFLGIHDLPELQCRLLKKEHSEDSARKRRVEDNPAVWDSLPLDVQDNILQRAGFRDLFRCKTLSKACKERIETDAFCQSRGATSEGVFTAISYYIRNDAWQCSGYDLESSSWRALPTLSYLPAPDADLFKEFFVSGHRSLMCGYLSKLPKRGELVVFNPLKGKKRVLPPLLHPGSPVLVHISVDSSEKSYTVVVAGHLAKKVEVFHSTTSKWTEASDVPGHMFGLNEHQAGVSINGILYLIAFREGSWHRGVVAFDLENGTFLEDQTFSIPFSLHSNTLQLVECNGKLHLFSEQERGASVEHCVDVLESSREGTWHLKNVVRVIKSGGRALQVYPEHSCVSFGEGKLCLLNTRSRDGVVYDMRDGKQVAVLPPPPANQKGDKFFTLNPALFTLQPSFGSDPRTS